MYLGLRNGVLVPGKVCVISREGDLLTLESSVNFSEHLSPSLPKKRVTLAPTLYVCVRAKERSQVGPQAMPGSWGRCSEMWTLS